VVVGNERDLEVIEESLDQASHQVRVFNRTEIVIVSAAQLLQNVIFLIDRSTLSENTFQFKSLRVDFEV
jgi:hypothetical protein